jgi:hypothetical protein
MGDTGLGIPLATDDYVSGRVVIMNALFGSSRVQYAVIEAIEPGGGCEHFVIAYRDEQLLREWIAAPCIVATGFASRNAALMKARAQIGRVVA